MTEYIIMANDGFGWRYCKSDDEFGCTSEIGDALRYTIEAGARPLQKNLPSFTRSKPRSSRWWHDQDNHWHHNSVKRWPVAGLSSAEYSYRLRTGKRLVAPLLHHTLRPNQGLTDKGRGKGSANPLPSLARKV